MKHITTEKERGLAEQYKNDDFLKAILTETPKRCHSRLVAMRAVISDINQEKSRKRLEREAELQRPSIDRQNKAVTIALAGFDQSPSSVQIEHYAAALKSEPDIDTWRRTRTNELRLKKLGFKGATVRENGVLAKELTEEGSLTAAAHGNARSVIEASVRVNNPIGIPTSQLSAADKRVCNPEYLVLPPNKIRIPYEELKDRGLTRADISWPHKCHYHEGRTEFEALDYLQFSSYYQHAWENVKTGSEWEKPAEIVAIKNALLSERKKTLPYGGVVYDIGGVTYDTGSPVSVSAGRYSYVGAEPRRTWLFEEGIGAVFKPVTKREIRTLTAVRKIHSRYPL